jgi:hypothetical protein
MRSGNPWRHLAATACAGVALLAAGCGSSGSASHAATKTSKTTTAATTAPVSNVDPLVTAAVASNATAGFKLNLSIQITTPDLPSAIDVTGAGDYATKARTGALNLNLNLGSVAGLATLLGSNSSLTIQELLNGADVYVKLPALLSSRISGGKPWLEVNLAKLAAQHGVSGLSSLLENPAASNPAVILQYLKAVSSTTVTKLGTATIDGYPTTHYRATIDLAKYPAAVPAADRTAAAAAIKALEKSSSLKDLPINVWVGQHNLVRRMSVELSQPVGSLGTLGVALTIDLSDYGPQPTPTYPPASQVTNASSLLSAASSLNP